MKWKVVRKCILNTTLHFGDCTFDRNQVTCEEEGYHAPGINAVKMRLRGMVQ